MLNWLSDSRKDGYYLNEEGMYEVVFGSPENYAHKYDLRKFPAVGNLVNWPSDSRKDDLKGVVSPNTPLEWPIDSQKYAQKMSSRSM